MWQTIDLTQYVDESLIDSGIVNFNLSAWLGGYTSQDDSARISLDFYDASRQYVGNQTTIGPVLSSDRLLSTSLLARSATGSIPVGARTVTLLVTMIRDTGTLNSADVDNIGLYLYK